MKCCTLCGAKTLDNPCHRIDCIFYRIQKNKCEARLDYAHWYQKIRRKAINVLPGKIV